MYKRGCAVLFLSSWYALFVSIAVTWNGAVITNNINTNLFKIYSWFLLRKFKVVCLISSNKNPRKIPLESINKSCTPGFRPSMKSCKTSVTNANMSKLYSIWRFNKCPGLHIKVIDEIRKNKRKCPILYVSAVSWVGVNWKENVLCVWMKVWGLYVTKSCSRASLTYVGIRVPAIIINPNIIMVQ